MNKQTFLLNNTPSLVTLQVARRCRSEASSSASLRAISHENLVKRTQNNAESRYERAFLKREGARRRQLKRAAGGES